MKTIVVQLVPEEDYGYGKAMRVIASDHPRFTVGYRFDFGFMNIVTDEGYTVVSLPMPPSDNVEVAKSSHNIAMVPCKKVTDILCWHGPASSKLCRLEALVAQHQ